jgi:hypothetical protein
MEIDFLIPVAVVALWSKMEDTLNSAVVHPV